MNMGNFQYKTSKDYERLVELIESGHSVICVLDDTTILRAFKSKLTGQYEIGWGQYLHIGSYQLSRFVLGCEESNLEFLDPTLPGELVDALKEVEWITTNCSPQKSCPCCGRYESASHEENCKIANAINKAEGK